MANKKTQSEKLEAMFDALGESVCNEGADAILEDLRQESVHPRVRTKASGLVDASVWFDHPVAAGFGIEEHSIRTPYGNVLSLLWWKDEDMLIKVEEFEDERAVRRSDERADE